MHRVWSADSFEASFLPSSRKLIRYRYACSATRVPEPEGHALSGDTSSTSRTVLCLTRTSRTRIFNILYWTGIIRGFTSSTTSRTVPVTRTCRTRIYYTVLEYVIRGVKELVKDTFSRCRRLVRWSVSFARRSSFGICPNRNVRHPPRTPRLAPLYSCPINLYNTQSSVELK
jgi:hypothetical protein